jgi:hypothetical protein
MNTTESLQKLVDTGIIGKCEKHGEVVYFDASETCPTCAEKPTKSKKKPVPVPVKETPKEEVPQDFVGKIQSFIQNPKNTKFKIFLGVMIFILLWLMFNYGAIMSYFK